MAKSSGIPKGDSGTFCPANRREWRGWLEEHHQIKQSVWVIYYKKNSPKYSMAWSEAVDEALCFGWIDSTRRTLDEERFMQFFTRRKPGSVWSKINKDKVERLIGEGLMTAAGHASIETAKKNGNWNILDEVEDMIMPKDLEKALKAHPGAKIFFMSLSPSVRKNAFYWIAMAKRAETRQKRIDTVADASRRKEKIRQIWG